MKNYIELIMPSIKKHLPEILTGFGIGSMIGGSIYMIPATVKAVKEIEAVKEKDRVDDLSVKTKIKICWKYYIPSTVMMIIGAGCMIGSTVTNHRRNVALATAYSTSELAFREYKNILKDSISEEKQAEIENKIHEKRIEAFPTGIYQGAEDVFCYEPFTGRYFKTTVNKLEKIINELNMRMINGENIIMLADFFDEIGLKHVGAGYAVGWDIYKNGKIDINITGHVRSDGLPTLSIEYYNPPVYIR